MMHFNPLFLQVINSNSVDSKSPKISNSSYLFSDIIKVYSEKNDIKSDNSGCAESSLMDFIQQLLPSVNQDQMLSVDSSKQVSGELFNSITLNNKQVNEFISQLLNGKNSQGTSIILGGKEGKIIYQKNTDEDQSKIQGNIEFNPQAILDYLKAGNVLLLESNGANEEQGLMVSIETKEEESSVPKEFVNEHTKALIENEKYILNFSILDNQVSSSLGSALSDQKNSEIFIADVGTKDLKIGIKIQENGIRPQTLSNKSLKTSGTESKPEQVKVETSSENFGPGELLNENKTTEKEVSISANQNKSDAKVTIEKPITDEQANQISGKPSGEDINKLKTELHKVNGKISSQNKEADLKVESSSVKVESSPAQVDNETVIITKDSSVQIKSEVKELNTTKEIPDAKNTKSENTTIKDEKNTVKTSDAEKISELKPEEVKKILVSTNQPEFRKTKIKANHVEVNKTEQKDATRNKELPKNIFNKAMKQAGVDKGNSKISENSLNDGVKEIRQQINNQEHIQSKKTEILKDTNVAVSHTVAENEQSKNLAALETKDQKTEIETHSNKQSSPGKEQSNLTENKSQQNESFSFSKSSEARIKQEFNLNEIQAGSKLNQQPEFTPDLKVVKTIEVIKEISKFIKKRDSENIVLKLDPEHLGLVKVALESTDTMIKAHIEVENEAAKQVIEKNLNQLFSSLNQNGVQLNSVNISLMNNEQKAGKNFVPKKKFGGENKKIVDDEKIISNEKNMGYNTYEYLI